MPVNFQTIQVQIREMGQQALPRQRELEDRLKKALDKLAETAGELDALKQRVDQAFNLNSSLRCAVPVTERLDAHLPTPAIRPDFALIAADGSQVVPSHHDAVEFGVINVGAIRMQPGAPCAPRELVESKLLCFDELYTSDGGLLSEEIVALMRDIAERRALAEYAQAELPRLVVTLTDGQLEIFGASRASSEFQQKLEEFTRVQEQLAGMGVVTAGYVAKPNSDLVVRLLDLMFLEDSELKQAGEKRRLAGITDRQLFTHMLGPGERSAVFAIQSNSALKFAEPLRPNFFYFNPAQSGRAQLARVEVPGWVAQDEAMIDLLHHALSGQCRQMGSRPYPYALHRAHEIAVVSLQEKSELENMILVELRRQGVDISEISEKQFAKLLGGRTRYGR